MKKHIIPNIEKEILTLLKKKDYLPITQIKNSLSLASRKYLGITKKDQVSYILKKLKPYLKNRLKEYKTSKYKYIGFNISLNKIILKNIKQNPGISSLQLKNSLPVTNKIFLTHLSCLIKEGSIVFTLREKDHVPLLKIAELNSEYQKNTEDDRKAFKAAYDKQGMGRSFVRIHRIREELNWTYEFFNSVLIDLMRDYRIELHGGDPSVLTEKEIQDSFTDENGMLYITLTWR
ncbi:Winged helix-turn-helix domain-containing protein [Candidatus Magnetomoraceae bacterium gMMP-15]